jgi:diguanylate cyclase (GGDEF)-like protein
MIFMIMHAIKLNWLNAGILLGFLFLNATAQLIYRYYRNLILFGLMQTSVVYTLCLYMLATGGTDGSGALWILALPLLVFGVMRSRTAVLICVFTLASMLFVLYGPLQNLYHASYSEMIKIVCCVNFAVITMISYLPARIREKAVNASEHLTNELRIMASTDELTMLANRRDLSLRMDFEFKRGKRSPSTFSIILYDIDYFKKINDSFGHGTGDQALINFGKLLKARFRETDKVGRWGGEEFLVLLPNTSLTEAIDIADTFRRDVCQANLIPNMPSKMVSVSAGVCSNDEANDTEGMLKLADQRLYAAKQNGRNRTEPTAQGL